MTQRTSVTIPIASASRQQSPVPQRRVDPAPLPDSLAALSLTDVREMTILDQRGLFQRVMPSSLGGIKPREVIIKPLKDLTPTPREAPIGNPKKRGAMINIDCLGASLVKSTSQLIFGNLSHPRFNPGGASSFTRQEMNMVIAYHLATATDTETGVMSVMREVPGS